MSVKLVMLKSGEDIIADVKEIRGTSEDVVGYYFDEPLVLKIYSTDEPTVLSEHEGVETENGVTKQFGSKLGVTFYPWVPLSAERNIPCSADWVVTIVEPIENLKKLYEEKVNGRPTNNQNPIVINE
jgi:hypothetical protein